MPIYNGSEKIKDIYLGSTKISKVYKGSVLVYTADPYKKGTVIFESAVAGTYSVELLGSGNYEVYCIGGGAGGVGHTQGIARDFAGGGSGSGFIGVVKLAKGTYSTTVGNGGAKVTSTSTLIYGNDGGDSYIGSLIRAYGGKSGCAKGSSGGYGGDGGNVPSISVEILSATLNTAGIKGSYGSSTAGVTTCSGGSSVYNSYGSGGKAGFSVGDTYDGTAGYIKIVYVGG